MKSSHTCKTGTIRHPQLGIRLVVSALLALGFAGCTAQHKPDASTASTVGTAATVSTNQAPSRPKPTEPSPSTAQDEISLFDGKSLKGWRESDFAGHGEVTVEAGKILLGMGVMTGVTWTGDIPRMNYEVNVEAMRVEGSDFFCALTFPVGTNPCSLIVGGWGGGVVGLSSLDGEDAANNETTKYMSFQNGRWYSVRLRVMPEKIQAWIDDEKVVDVVTKERRISIRFEVEPSLPFGFASWSTAAALRNITLRRL
jgi:hypothetical protein